MLKPEPLNESQGQASQEFYCLIPGSQNWIYASPTVPWYEPIQAGVCLPEVVLAANQFHVCDPVKVLGPAL